jgi:hypothetical protein
MPGENYTSAQNQFLLDQLAENGNKAKREEFVTLEEFWPGFFGGQKKTAFALFAHTKRLAKKKGIAMEVISAPLRNRNRKPSNRVPARFTKGRIFDQIVGIIQMEMRQAERRASAKILRLIEDLADENRNLKEELKDLYPYKALVEQKYSTELEFRKGGI